jgi:hypothetical protein
MDRKCGEIMFSPEELETYTYGELKQLARWYKIKHAKSIKKEALLDLLIEKLYASPIKQDGDTVKMSVRVKRIKELNKL